MYFFREAIVGANISGMSGKFPSGDYSFTSQDVDGHVKGTDACSRKTLVNGDPNTRLLFQDEEKVTSSSAHQGYAASSANSTIRWNIDKKYRSQTIGKQDSNLQSLVKRVKNNNLADPIAAHALLATDTPRGMRQTLVAHQQFDNLLDDKTGARNAPLLHLYNSVKQMLGGPERKQFWWSHQDYDDEYFGEEKNIPKQFWNDITAPDAQKLSDAALTCESLALKLNPFFVEQTAKLIDKRSAEGSEAFDELNDVIWHGDYPGKKEDVLKNSRKFIAESYNAMSLALWCAGTHISILKRQMEQHPELQTDENQQKIQMTDAVYKNACDVMDQVYVSFKKFSGKNTIKEDIPPGFPKHIPVSRQTYKNWSREIKKKVFTCTPNNEQDVLDAVNWAAQNGWKVRPRGAMHNWSPLTLAPDDKKAAATVLLVNTSKLKNVSVDKESGTVTSQTGITMEEWLTALENENLGVVATPAPGDITLGGVLAIGGHGTCIPAKGESRNDGHTFGSLSNSILSLKAVAWDEEKNKYGIRTFHRHDPDCQAFLVHLGRTFIVEVKMQVGPNQNLRCRSYEDIPADTLFASPVEKGKIKETEGKIFSEFMEDAGRIEAIWFPYTKKVWLKTWSVSPEKPAESKEINKPYNFPFSHSLDESYSGLVREIVSHGGRLTPQFSKLSTKVVSKGLKNSKDIWGKSKNLLLYIKPCTLKATVNGYAVLTKRDDVQRVVSDFHQKVHTLLEEYKKQGSYPVNAAIEIRVTGLDKKEEVMVGENGELARSPLLSALRQRPDHPEWNVAVWLDILTVPGTKNANKFYKEIEDWTFENYSGDYAGVRVEWSKGWGYTEDRGPWSNEKILDETVPTSVDAGQADGGGWNKAVDTFDRYDPHRLFLSPMLDNLFKKRPDGEETEARIQE